MLLFPESSELEVIVRSAYGPLLLYARQWDDNLAEDAVQTAMIKLASRLDTADRPENILAWLFQVVRNELKYRSRQQRTSRKHLEHYAQARRPWFITSTETRLDAEEVAAKLAALPLEQRETIVARIWGDLSFEEIATLLGTSSSTAHRRYVEGLQTLKKMVQR